MGTQVNKNSCSGNRRNEGEDGEAGGGVARISEDGRRGGDVRRGDQVGAAGHAGRGTFIAHT